MRRFAVVALAVALCGLPLRAGQEGEPQVSFRSGVELVELTVSVLDGDRHPIGALTQDDFTVREDGVERPIVAFSEVRLDPPAPAAAAWVRDVQPDVATNLRADGGRLVVILFDRSIPAGLPTITARNIARAAVDELGPSDLAAVIFTGVGAPQNFTRDRERLYRAIDGADPSTEPSEDAGDLETSVAVEEMNAQSSAGSIKAGQCYCGVCVPETITNVATTLRDVPRRKSLLFIGRTMEFQSTEMDCSFRLREATDDMMRALDMANVTVHALDPVGLDVVSPAARSSSPLRVGRGRQRVVQSLETNLQEQNALGVLPDRTGGRAVVGTNAPQEAMKAIFDESRIYYLIAFDAGPAEPGTTHTIDVKTSRRGAKVYTRRRYVEADETGPAGGPIPGVVAETLARATASARPVADIPIGLSVVPFAAPGSEAADVILVYGMRYPVAAEAGPQASQAGASRREQLTVLAGAFDRYARPRGEDQRSLVFTLPASAAGELPFESFARLSLRPGSYEIRLGAAAASGTPSGSVFTYVDVPDFARAPLSLSGLVLSVAPNPLVAAGDVIDGRLPVVPTSRRSFGRGEQVTAFLRVYEGGDDAIEPVDVVVRVTTAGGRVALERAVPLDASRFSSERAADVRVDLPLTNFNPGEHLLTVEVTRGDRVVTRDVRFTVAPPQAPSPKPQA